MAKGKPLLVELRTEEMPPLLLEDVAAGVAANLVKALADAQLCAPDADARNWSTPRRIAVLIEKVAASSTATSSVRRGPSVQNAYGGDGKPTAALTGFLRSCGATQKDLQEIDYKGQPYVAVPQSSGGEPLAELLGPALERAIAQTVAPRLMRWGTGGHRFVRPIRGLCAVHAKKPVKAHAFGLTSAGDTLGHRFLGGGKPAKIANAVDYPAIMATHKVVVETAERRDIIRRQAKELAPQARIDEELLREVANMCEWPQCYLAKFDAKYQELPNKVIETCMGKHLRSFAIGKRSLKNEFIFVADNKPSDKGKLLRRGLERVMRARLDDTLFIHQRDSQVKPPELLSRIDSISYLQGMGTMLARCARIQELAAGPYADSLQLDAPAKATLSQAAQHVKADLGTLLVDEYPSLEGYIGAELLANHLPDEARALIRGHLDRGLDAQANPTRDALILALELERLTTIAATAGLPKGSRDPQALRRAMGRVVRVLQRHPGVDLDELLRVAWRPCHEAAKKFGALKAGRFAQDEDGLRLDLKRFALERIVNMASDLLGRPVARRTLNAVSARALPAGDKTAPLDVADILKRIEALEAFISSNPKQLERMLEIAKRLNNITRQREKLLISSKHEGNGAKQAENGSQLAFGSVKENLLVEEAEMGLFQACSDCSPESKELAASGDYDGYYRRIVKIAPAVDRFFDDVMVNADDAQLRANRINLVGMAAQLLNEKIDTRSLYA